MLQNLQKSAFSGLKNAEIINSSENQLKTVLEKQGSTPEMINSSPTYSSNNVNKNALNAFFENEKQREIEGNGKLAQV